MTEEEKTEFAVQKFHQNAEIANSVVMFYQKEAEKVSPIERIFLTLVLKKLFEKMEAYNKKVNIQLKKLKAEDFKLIEAAASEMVEMSVNSAVEPQEFLKTKNLHNKDRAIT